MWKINSLLRSHRLKPRTQSLERKCIGLFPTNTNQCCATCTNHYRCYANTAVWFFVSVEVKIICLCGFILSLKGKQTHTSQYLQKLTFQTKKWFMKSFYGNLSFHAEGEKVKKGIWKKPNPTNNKTPTELEHLWNANIWNWLLFKDIFSELFFYVLLNLLNPAARANICNYRTCFFLCNIDTY